MRPVIAAAIVLAVTLGRGVLPGQDPEDHAGVLLRGHPAGWAAAVEDLCAERGPEVEWLWTRFALRFAVPEKRKVAAWFRKRSRLYRPYQVIDTLVDLAADEDATVRDLARRALGRRSEVYAFERVCDLVGPGLPDQAEAMSLLTRVHGRVRRRLARPADRWTDPDSWGFRGVEGSAAERLAGLLTDPSAAVVARARESLSELEGSAGVAWQDSVEPPPRPLTDLVLALSSLLSVAMGVALFLLAFRLWGMRRLLHGIPVSPVRSLAAGSVAVRGRARPRGGLQEHPFTGEPCVVHAHSADQRFYVEDDTGRVLVDGAAAVLLSEDGTITVGEPVHVVATARPDGADLVLGAEPARPSAWDRLCSILLRITFGPGERGASTRMLFQRPEQFCWIFDDARDRPLQGPRETGWLVLTFALAGCWTVLAITVFFATLA